MPIKFRCQSCSRKLSVPDKVAGKSIKCPACSERIKVPLSSSLPPEPKPVIKKVNENKPQQATNTPDPGKTEPPPIPQQEEIISTDNSTKDCPFCGEPILLAAIKCKHCGSMLSSSPEQKTPQTETLGLICLFLPICATIISWAWISSMTLLDSPESKHTGVMAITIVITALLIALEANSVGAGKIDPGTEQAKAKREEGPIAWFFVCSLLWIVGFPAWMFRRAKYGFRNLGIGAILVTIVFCAGNGILSTAIEDARKDAQNQLQNAFTEAEEALKRDMEKAQRDFELEMKKMQSDF